MAWCEGVLQPYLTACGALQSVKSLKSPRAQRVEHAQSREGRLEEPMVDNGSCFQSTDQDLLSTLSRNLQAKRPGCIPLLQDDRIREPREHGRQGQDSFLIQIVVLLQLKKVE